MHPSFNHSFSNTSYSLSATIAARLLKNVNPSVIHWPKYSQTLTTIREYQSSLASRVKSEIVNNKLDYHWKPITANNGKKLSYSDKTGDYEFEVNDDYFSWYDHLDNFKKEEAKKAMAYLSRKHILNEKLLIKNNKLQHSTLKLYCKAFVKVEIALRHISKPIRPRMIQFLPPTFMVNLAPHAYLCYKILKNFTTDPFKLYVNTSGTTYAQLSEKIADALFKCQNGGGNNLQDLCTLFFNGDDSLLLVNKSLFLSGKWIDGSTIWGRDPVTHRKTSIYLASYCSGWFVRYYNGTKHVPFFEPRPFKAITKFSYVIASQALNQAKHADKLELLKELIEARALSLYYSFQLDPFVARLALVWLRRVDSAWYPKLLEHYEGRANDNLSNLTADFEHSLNELHSRFSYQDQVRLNINNVFKHNPSGMLPIYDRASVWWSYSVNYSATKGQLEGLLSRMENIINSIPINEYKFFDDPLLEELIQADLDAKNPCVSQQDVWFDNEGDIGIYEVDCSAYDSTTQIHSLEHNMWFQRQCFGDTLFIDAISLRKRMKVQSHSPYQTASWFTLCQMLSGYYDTSIGNGICNCTEITTSMLLTYPQCVLRYE